MSRLVLAGYLLAAAPMVLAVLLAAAAIERLTVHTESLLEQGVVATRLSSRLQDELVDLERNARQYRVIGSPELGNVVTQRLARVEQTLQELQQVRADAELQQAIAQLQAAVAAQAQAWKGTPENPRAADVLATAVNGLVRDARALTALGDAAIDRENASLQAAGERSRWIIGIALGALLPLTVILASALSRIVLKPLREAEQGIDDLGHGRYQRTIAISSPEEMRLLGEQLDWLRRRLAQLESDKDRFLSHVTHELKTPLSSLREGVALLADHSLGGLTASQQEVVEILDASAHELEAMVNKLLDYAEWRREKKDARPEWFALSTVLQDIVARRTLALDTRDLQIRQDLGEGRIWGQRSRLQEVMDNLLGNAIKHAPDGTLIEVTSRHADGHCEIRVRDHGRGVPAHLGARIFEPFVRGDVAVESAVRGTGIGLSIVRETLIEHGGTVEVEDAQPGARFVLRWPVPDEPERMRELPSRQPTGR